MILYSKEVKKISLPVSRYFLYAGLGFYFYSIFAGLIPSHVKIPIISIPVEFFRGTCAVLITAFLFKALNIFDIHTRKKLEQQIKNQAQSEKMSSLGLLSAGVAHEINSPLTNASLNMQMLRSQFNTTLNDKKIQKNWMPLIEILKGLQSLQKNCSNSPKHRKQCYTQWILIRF
ncbi:hypothetical protein [Desulfobacula sp.]|uniref:hypothetical protein n=1 Tax=Desulfobacula sp. TaxID=2593537 RepID=UPI001E179FFA|nr:hypothetical protein [Desulfobacula sp.]